MSGYTSGMRILLFCALTALFLVTPNAKANESRLTIRQTLVSALEFKNGYSETIGLRDNETDSGCASYISLEDPTTIRFGISDGDFHATYALSSQSSVVFNSDRTQLVITDASKKISLKITIAQRKIAVEWNERYFDLGIIPRTLHTLCR